MNKLQNVILNKHKILPHIIKKISRRYFLFRYMWGKSYKINPQVNELKKIKRHLKVVNENDLYKYVLRKMNYSLISKDIDNVVEELKKDTKFIKTLERESIKTCSNIFMILWNYYDDVYDKSTGHYRWKTDIKNGYNYNSVHYTQINGESLDNGSDIKMPWEMSRMQYLFGPALMWRITKDRKYSEFVSNVILDWIECNQYEEGPNWSNAMEVGIRITNILLAYQLINNDKELSKDLTVKVITCASLHLKYIMNNKENYAGNTYNHYLANLLGILSITTTFPFLKFAGKYSAFAVSELEKEMQKQILNDGGDFEGSTCYHGLVSEIFAVSTLLCNNSKINLSPQYFAILLKITQYSLAIEKPNMLFPQIGDNDSGRIFVLRYQEPLCYRPAINLSYWLTQNKLIYDEYKNDIMCLTGLIKNIIHCDNYKNAQYINIFEDSRIVLYKAEEIYCLMTAVESNRFGLGGHTHNDKLSIEINYKGKDFIVDPGSGSYTACPEVHRKLRSVKSHSSVSINNHEQNEKQTMELFGHSYNAFTELYNPSFDGSNINISGKVDVSQDAFKYSHLRNVKIERENSKISITDNISAEIGSEVLWSFLLHPDVKVSLDGDKVSLSNGDAKLDIVTFSKVKLETGIYSKSYGEWQETHIIYFSKKHKSDDCKYLIEFKFA